MELRAPRCVISASQALTCALILGDPSVYEVLGRECLLVGWPEERRVLELLGWREVAELCLRLGSASR